MNKVITQELNTEDLFQAITCIVTSFFFLKKEVSNEAIKLVLKSFGILNFDEKILEYIVEQCVKNKDKIENVLNNRADLTLSNSTHSAQGASAESEKKEEIKEAIKEEVFEDEFF